MEFRTQNQGETYIIDGQEVDRATVEEALAIFEERNGISFARAVAARMGIDNTAGRADVVDRVTPTPDTRTVASIGASEALSLVNIEKDYFRY